MPTSTLFASFGLAAVAALSGCAVVATQPAQPTPSQQTAPSDKAEVQQTESAAQQTESKTVTTEKILLPSAYITRYQPPPPAPKPPVKRLTLNASDNFDTDKAVLSASGKAQIDAVIRQSGLSSITGVRVVGHTDSVASHEYNLGLSLRRANAVKSYLISRGVDSATVSTSGRGEEEPIADNRTAEGRARNRRVEIDFSYKSEN